MILLLEQVKVIILNSFWKNVDMLFKKKIPDHFDEEDPDEENSDKESSNQENSDD